MATKALAVFESEPTRNVTWKKQTSGEQKLAFGSHLAFLGGTSFEYSKALEVRDAKTGRLQWRTVVFPSPYNGENIATAGSHLFILRGRYLSAYQ